MNETADGALYLSCRNDVAARRRAYACSFDGRRSFPRTGYDGLARARFDLEWLSEGEHSLAERPAD